MFKQWLVRRRLIAGMTQQQLADKLGVSRSSVGEWEQGANLPGPSLIPALADALGVSRETLVDRMAKDKKGKVAA